eukprot:Nk52_evm29s1360 gene=Nk52_evmTU29s1360
MADAEQEPCLGAGKEGPGGSIKDEREQQHGEEIEFRQSEEIGEIALDNISFTEDELRNFDPDVAVDYALDEDEEKHRSRGEVDNEPKKKAAPFGGESAHFVNATDRIQRLFMEEEQEYERVMTKPIAELNPLEQWQKIIRKVMFVNRLTVATKSLKEEERAKVDEESRFMLSPDSVFVTTKGYLMLTFLAFDLFMIPYIIAFGPQGDEGGAADMFNIWYALGDILYILNILVNARTGIIVQGKVTYDKKLIMRNYINTFLLVDVLAAIPLDLMFIGHQYQAYVRMNRLLRGKRLFNYFDSLEDRTHRPGIIRLFKMVYFLFMLSHIIGCIYWIIVVTEGFPNVEFPGQLTWAPDKRFEHAARFSQWLQAIYWAFTSMTGLGAKANPITDAETIYTMCVMFVGVCLYAYIIGNVGSLIGNMDANRNLHRQKMIQLKKFMRYRRLPPELSLRVRTYHDLVWNYHQGFDDHEILSDLPTSLRTDIARYISKDMVVSVPFFRGCAEGFIDAVTMALRATVCSPHEIIIRRGSVGQEMYFIHRGSVAVLSATGQQIAELGRGSFFGEMALFLEQTRSADVEALTYCDFYTLSKEDFQTILKEYPEETGKMRQYVEARVDDLENFLIKEAESLNRASIASMDNTAKGVVAVSPDLEEVVEVDKNLESTGESEDKLEDMVTPSRGRTSFRGSVRKRSSVAPARRISNAIAEHSSRPHASRDENKPKNNDNIKSFLKKTFSIGGLNYTELSDDAGATL